MLKSESLIQLVNNLTKQEKKEFSLYITNKSEKDYIFLFRLIDDKKISDPEELKKSFLTVKPTSSFNTVVVYLFDLLISILTRIRTEQIVIIFYLMNYCMRGFYMKNLCIKNAFMY